MSSSAAAVRRPPILRPVLLAAASFAAFFVSSSAPVASSASSSSSSSSSPSRPRLVLAVDGGTESIRARCFDAETGRAVGEACAAPYVTRHPHPGWAEQDPEEWWERLGEAVRGALDSLDGGSGERETGDGDGDGESAEAAEGEEGAGGNEGGGDDGEGEEQERYSRDDVCAMCVDTTCCSVVALSSSYEPLRPCLLWMDARSAPQTAEILKKCRGDRALRVNGGGKGPLSAEWMTPKALWIKTNEPEVWDAAETVCEYQDYINYKLTGRMVASSCNAASRWHWDGEECLRVPSAKDRRPGRPMSLYRKLGMPELADKLPRECLPMGSPVGDGLTDGAAAHLGLWPGLPVAQGGPDAFVGMIGLGCVRPGQMCLITGSSHLHCVVSAKPTAAPGTWGAYRGAPLPGLNFAEGGQSSTGSIARWAKSLFGGDELSYAALDDEASRIPPGSDGLLALETFQGSRTPVTDPLARGALVGLTLSHTRAHVWRALLESVCLGTRACVDGLADAGHPCGEIVAAGGATRSELWLRMHADATGRTVVMRECADAPLLGCAILAAVCAGIHGSVDEACDAMVRTARRIEPEDGTREAYDALYRGAYRKLGPAARPVAHAIAALRGGGGRRRDDRSGPRRVATAAAALRPAVLDVRGGGDTASDATAGLAATTKTTPRRRRSVVVSPSLLAADWSDLRSALEDCVAASCPRIHVDVFDGVWIDSPHALTFGPQMVRALRDYCDGGGNGGGGGGLADVELDVHLCVERPARFVGALAESGAARVIFQWEGVGRDLEEAVGMVRDIRAGGMKAGVSVDPSTDVGEILPLLDAAAGGAGGLDTVDVLAVEPGFGGQKFQPSALEKLRLLCDWRTDRGLRPEEVKFMVDGGINGETAKETADAGADILVAGTSLFRHRVSFRKGVEEILGKC